MKQLFNHSTDPLAGERGQSIVLIAAAIVGLIAMIGLAVDVGLVFARGAQLQAAVDAAALAGVTELKTVGSVLQRKEVADEKAQQFLKANEMPDDVVASLRSSADTTPIGQRLYRVEADWNVELFFLRVIGRGQIQITREAEAAFFPLADIYASRRVEDGIVSTSNQGIFGPDICTAWGDPFSPRGATNTPKPRNADGTYSYTYRILVPKSYREDNRYLQVELFDPETYNQDITTQPVTLTRSSLAQSFGLPAESTEFCPSGSPRNRWNPCLIRTGEITLTSVTTANISLDQINPYWIVRLDENRGTGDTSCTSRSSYLEQYNTETRFELYYFLENSDGTISRIDLSTYNGKKDNSDNTDLRWVVPGVTPGVNVPPGSKTFLLDLQEVDGRPAGDVPGILVDAGNEDVYIYLDVTSFSGGSENGFEVWAGPPSTDPNLPENVNERNLYILDHPGTHNSQGAVVFALGNLPMNSNFGLTNDEVQQGRVGEQAEKIVEVDIPLIYVGAEYAGAEVEIRLYDADSGATPPITFYFDSVAEEDWSITYGDTDQGRCFEVDDIVDARNPAACGSKWIDPAYKFTVPGVLDNCDWNNPTPETCTPFYGGRLVARYRGGFSDTFGWEISVEGLPYLTK